MADFAYKKTARAAACRFEGFYVKELSAELRVVVTAVGRPHLQHVDGIVKVSDPAGTGYVIVALLSFVEEYFPIDALDGHLYADGGKVLLYGLRNGLMCGMGVGQVLKAQRSVRGELVVLAKLKASLF